MKQKNSSMSLIFLITSMLIYGSIGIFRKFIPLSSSMLAFARGIIGFAFLLAIFLIKKKNSDAKTSPKTLWLIIASGALIGINWMLLFEAYNYTTVATATLCYYMSPVILILLAPFFFKERLTIVRIICTVVAFAGMVLVSGITNGGSISSGEIKGIALGLGAAVIYAIVVIINKRLPDMDIYKKTMLQLLFAGLAMIPYLLLTGNITTGAIDTRAIVLIIVVGIVHTGIAYALYFASMKGLRAGTLAIFSYIDPITAIFLAWIILKEAMSPAAITGAIMIIGSAICIERAN